MNKQQVINLGTTLTISVGIWFFPKLVAIAFALTGLSILFHDLIMNGFTDF